MCRQCTWVAALFSHLFTIEGKKASSPYVEHELVVDFTDGIFSCSEKVSNLSGTETYEREAGGL